MYLLGYDIGTSSVKASLVNIGSGKAEASCFYPDTEAPIISLKQGWAEQDPASWMSYLKAATERVLTKAKAKGSHIQAIGISYQMHGLVCVDKNGEALRNSIIWCDSRAAAYGQQAFDDLGHEACLSTLLNSPGNFTASKLAWIKANEPDVFNKIHKIMLPGDYVAMKLSGGQINTTISGLSEGMFWDFSRNQVSQELLSYFGFSQSIIADIVPTFGIQARLCQSMASELGLQAGIPIAYRGGDQPNNALSLNVMQPGEIAATAGTSGVVYGVLGTTNYDKLSRVNTFAHGNHSSTQTRLGVLLCINGTGILNAWAKRNIAPANISYSQINELAAQAPIGSEGLSIIPFGNGAERMIENKDLGASISGINFNIHTKAHLLRAAQEGIVFSFAAGIEIMKQMGMRINNIHAAYANMFLSPIFATTLASITGATIDLYNTDGSVGAALGAGIGAGIYKDHNEAFANLEHIKTIEPDLANKAAYEQAYHKWTDCLGRMM